MALSYADRLKLAQKAASIIDTEWRFSWHWDRTEHGSITEKGWIQMRSDCDERIRRAEEDLESLRRLQAELDQV